MGIQNMVSALRNLVGSRGLFRKMKGKSTPLGHKALVPQKALLPLEILESRRLLSSSGGGASLAAILETPQALSSKAQTQFLSSPQVSIFQSPANQAVKQKFQVRGANYFGCLQADPGHWPKFLNYFRNFGVNTVRWLICEACNDSAPGGLGKCRNKQQYLTWIDQEIVQLQKAMEDLKKCGIRVIVNIHTMPGLETGAWGNVKKMEELGQKLYLRSDEEGKWRREALCEAWKKMAEKFKNNDAIIGYDILNEPAPMKNKEGVSWNEIVKKAVGAIRNVDQNKLIIVEPIGGNPDNINQDLIGALNLEKDPKIAFSFHHYANLLFKDATSTPTPEKIQQAHNRLDDILNRLHDKQVKNGNFQIILGEFGVAKFPGLKTDGDGFLKQYFTKIKEFGWDWLYFELDDEVRRNDPDRLAILHKNYGLNAPGGLCRGQVGADRVELKWTDHSNNESRFHIQMAVNGKWKDSGDASASSTQFVVTGLRANTQYQFRVRAENQWTVSDYSDILTVKTRKKKPTAPRNLRAQNAGTNQAILLWEANSDEEAGFHLQSSTDASHWADLGDNAVNVLSRVVGGLRPGTRTLFRVRAVNEEGVSDYSPAIEVNPLPPGISQPVWDIALKNQMGLPVGKGFDASGGWWGQAFQNGGIGVKGIEIHVANKLVWDTAQRAGLGVPTGDGFDSGGGWWGQAFQNGGIGVNGNEIHVANKFVWDTARRTGLGVPIGNGFEAGAGWWGQAFQNGGIGVNGNEIHVANKLVWDAVQRVGLGVPIGKGFDTGTGWWGQAFQNGGIGIRGGEIHLTLKVVWDTAQLAGLGVPIGDGFADPDGRWGQAFLDGGVHVQGPIVRVIPRSTPLKDWNRDGLVDVRPGQYLSLQPNNYPNQFVRHTNSRFYINPLENSSLYRDDASFRVRPGLADPNLVSLESVNYPGFFFRHSNSVLILSLGEDSDLFRQDATFRLLPGLANTSGITLQSLNYPTLFVRHCNSQLILSPNDGSDLFRQDATFLPVWALWGSSPFQQPSPNDWNKDGVEDLFVVKPSNTPSGKVEVDILDGACQYQRVLNHAVSIWPAGVPNMSFQLADFNGDGKNDLFAILEDRPDSRTLWVRVLDGNTGFASYLMGTQTILATPPGTTFQYQVLDYNSDGWQDLVAFKQNNTGTQSTEIHILDGATYFKSWVLETGTGLGETGAEGVLSLADLNRDGVPDLVYLKKYATGTGMTELHVMDGRSAYRFWARETGTALPMFTDPMAECRLVDYNRDGVQDVLILKKLETGSRKVEAHVLDGQNLGGFLLEIATPLEQWS